MNLLTMILIALAGSTLAILQSVNPVTYWAFQLSGFALAAYAGWFAFRAMIKHFNSK